MAGITQHWAWNDMEEDPYDNVQTPSALSHLKALTKLNCEVGLDDGDVGSIAACSQLKEQKVDTTNEDYNRVAVPGLQLLTQLTALSKLKLYLDYEERLLNHMLVSKCSSPDVHLQLQQLIADE